MRGAQRRQGDLQLALGDFNVAAGREELVPQRSAFLFGAYADGADVFVQRAPLGIGDRVDGSRGDFNLLVFRNAQVCGRRGGWLSTPRVARISRKGRRPV
jgi:hypothetical protein